MPTEAHLRERWIADNESAVDTLKMTVADNLIIYVSKLNYAYEIWGTWLAKFQRQTEEKHHELSHRFSSFHLLQDEHIDAYFDRFYALVEEMERFGMSVDSKAKAFRMKHGVIGTPVDDKLETLAAGTDWAVVETAIRRAAERVRLASVTLAGRQIQSSAAYAVTASKQRQKGRNAAQNRSQAQCFNCQGVGHFASTCSKPKAQSTRTPVASSTPTASAAAVVEQSSTDPPAATATAQSVTVVPDELVWNLAFSVSDFNNLGPQLTLDSAATRHFTNEASHLHHLKPFNMVCSLADGKTLLRAAGIGTMVIDVGDGKTIALDDVVLLPALAGVLLSVRALGETGKVTFETPDATYVRNDGLVVGGSCNATTGLFALHGTIVASPTHGTCNAITSAYVARGRKKKQSRAELWHGRFGHVHGAALSKCSKVTVGAPKLAAADVAHCKFCELGKAARVPFPGTGADRADEALGRIHLDVAGPVNVAGRFSGGKCSMRFFLIIKDDHSRMTVAVPMESKAATFATVKSWVRESENKLGRRVKIIRSDNGGEFLSHEFSAWMESKGITRELTPPHTPALNGVAERGIRTVSERARTMLLHAGLPASYWPDAVATAAYIENRCPSSANGGTTPYERWHGKAPNVGHLRTWGCSATVRIPLPAGKFAPRARKVIFIGYPKGVSGYRFWDPVAQEIVISRDAKFDERATELEEIRPRATPAESAFSEELDRVELAESEELQAEEEENARLAEQHALSLRKQERAEQQRAMQHYVDEAMPKSLRARAAVSVAGVRRSARSPKPSKTYPTKDWISMVTENVTSTTAGASTGNAPLHCDLDEPKSYKEAIRAPDAAEWDASMQQELKALMATGTFRLVRRSEAPAANLVGCRWVYTYKRNQAGEIVRRRSRVVAQGFTQQGGKTYHETFAPVAKQTTVRCAFSIAAANPHLVLRQGDVATAYLNGDFQETGEVIYMILPQGFVGPNGESTETGWVALLEKTLYGLKQSGRYWFEMFSGEIKKIGFKPSRVDPCCFVLRTGDEFCILVLYVDDYLLCGTPRTVARVEELLAARFKMSAQGPAEHLLGLQIDAQPGHVRVTQETYIRSVLARTGMASCKPAPTPMEHGLHLVKPTAEEVAAAAHHPYRRTLGMLMYAAVGTRPDIMHAVSVCAQFNEAWGEAHWVALQRILRYLAGTPSLGLSYKPGSHSVRAVTKHGQEMEINRQFVGYADADYAECRIDRRSYTAFIFMSAGAPISWQSKKQRTVAHSTVEAEYVASSAAAREGVAIRTLLQDMAVPGGPAAPTDTPVLVTEGRELPFLLLSDNQGAIALAHNPEQHQRSKHIDVHHHSLREKVADKSLVLAYTPTDVQLADFLTKPLAPKRHKELIAAAGLS